MEIDIERLAEAVAARLTEAAEASSRLLPRLAAEPLALPRLIIHQHFYGVREERTAFEVYRAAEQAFEKEFESR